MKKIIIFVIIVVLSFSTACSSQAGKTKELTSAQSDAIQRVIENKDSWKNNSGYGVTNWIYFWESERHIYYLCGYQKEANYGGLNFSMKCYQADTDKLRRIELDLERDKEQITQWAECGVEIDLETMSDSELESSLTQAYLKFLNTNPNHSVPLKFEYENDLMDALRQLENAADKYD